MMTDLGRLTFQPIQFESKLVLLFLVWQQRAVRNQAQKYASNKFCCNALPAG